MPKTILYPWSSFPHDNAEVTEAVDGFLRAMEDFVKTQRKVIDLEDEWRGQNPSGSRLPMSKYFNQVNSPTKTSLPNSNVDRTTAHIHLAGFDDNTRAFRSDFLTKFGKAPYFDRVNSEKLLVADCLL